MFTQEQAEAIAATGAAHLAPDGRRCFNTPLFVPFSQSLTAGESRIDLAQTVPPDADYYWRGVWFNPTSTGFLVTVRFRLSSGYYLSNVEMPLDQLNLEAITPELRIPAGNPIGLEATNGNVGTVKLQVCFIGVKRYYLEG